MEPVHRRCPVTRVAAMAFGAARTPSPRPHASRRHFGDLERKTVEAWLLHDFAADFYGRTLRLLVVGYVRLPLFARTVISSKENSATRPRMMTGSSSRPRK